MSILSTGRKVLEGLNHGRQIAIAQAQARSRERAETILNLAAADVLAGKPSRGRAGRISRKMGGEISESQIRRHLKIISRRLSSVQDSTAHDVTKQEALCEL